MRQRQSLPLPGAMSTMSDIDAAVNFDLAINLPTAASMSPNVNDLANFCFIMVRWTRSVHRPDR
jgi:hypothetical protein